MFRNVRNSINDHYLDFADYYPSIHLFLVSLARIFGYVFRVLLFVSKKYLDSVSVFFCIIIFLTLLFIPLNWVMQILLCIAVFIVASVGLSFLDWKENLTEHTVEEKQLTNARKLLALGLDHDPTSQPTLELPEAQPKKNELHPFQIVIRNTILMRGRSNQLELEFSHVESDPDADLYTFYASKDVSGVNFGKMITQLRKDLRLKELPMIQGRADQVFVKILHTSLPEDMLS